MENEFIPYEEAVALKELGFDEECFTCYSPDKRLINWWSEAEPLKNSDYKADRVKNYVTSPLYQQAFRWFREKHELYHSIYALPRDHRDMLITKGRTKSSSVYTQICIGTYEEAELDCLRKLIEIIKESK